MFAQEVVGRSAGACKNGRMSLDMQSIRPFEATPANIVAPELVYRARSSPRRYGSR